MKKFNGMINGTEYTDKEEFLKQLKSVDLNSGIKISYEETDVPEKEGQPAEPTVEETEDFELADFNPDVILEEFTDMDDFDKAAEASLKDAYNLIDQLVKDQDSQNLEYLSHVIEWDQDRYEELQGKNNNTIRTFNNQIRTLDTEIEKYEHLIDKCKNEIDGIYKKLDVLKKADHILSTGTNYCKELKRVLQNKLDLPNLECQKNKKSTDIDDKESADTTELDLLRRLIDILC